jgi:hypothetical protein
MIQTQDDAMQHKPCPEFVLPLLSVLSMGFSSVIGPGPALIPPTATLLLTRATNRQVHKKRITTL